MIIKVVTNIIIEVKDEDEAEDACHALGSLDSIMRNNSFPHELIDADVDHYEKVSDAEAAEQGWTEE